MKLRSFAAAFAILCAMGASETVRAQSVTVNSVAYDPETDSIVAEVSFTFSTDPRFIFARIDLALNADNSFGFDGGGTPEFANELASTTCTRSGSPMTIICAINVSNEVTFPRPQEEIYRVHAAMFYDQGCPDGVISRPANVTVPARPPEHDPATTNSLLSDVGQNLAGQLVDIVGDHLATPAGAAGTDASFVSLGGRTMSWADWNDANSARTSDTAREHMSASEFFNANPLTFGYHGGSGAAQAGGYTLWGRVGKQNFEGRSGGEEPVGYDGELFSSTLGVDYGLSQGLLGIGATYSEGDSKLGDNNAEVELYTVHPYLRWELGAATSAWGQIGYGDGDVRITDDAGEVISTEDFQLGFGALGVRHDYGELGAGDIGLAFKADAQAVQIDGDGIDGARSELDSDTWRLRAAVEAHTAHALSAGGTLRPALELGARYDGGDTQEGLGLDAGASLRMDDAARGLTIEGNGRYLVTHRESSKKQWNVGALVSFDVGAQGRGLALSVAPSYGADATADGWSDRLRLSEAQAQAKLRTTISYGTGALGGRASVTPYGRLELGATRKVRGGLLTEFSADKLSVDVYAEQSSSDESVTENSLQVRLALDY